MSTCLACKSSGPHTPYTVREMMLGTREQFQYFECLNCGSLQRKDKIDIGRFYPKNYYSFAERDKSGPRNYLRSVRDKQLLGEKSLLGFALSAYWPDPRLSMLGELGVSRSSRILDVGCGSGALLRRLLVAGFNRLTGADPFISEEFHSQGLILLKNSIHQVDGEFDFIIFNHSLEHVSDPVADLTAAKLRLSKDGICIVRIPTTSSLAWEKYRRDWVQIDAPRHVFIPSRTAMDEIATRSGFSMHQTFDDSTAFQFTGSELYKKDIALNAAPANFFSHKELRAFEQKASELNSQNRGDQVAFIFH